MYYPKSHTRNWDRAVKRLQNVNSELSEERFVYHALKASEEEGELLITFLVALVFLRRRYGKTREEAEYITEYANTELDSEE